jgi:hypothetical protein
MADALESIGKIITEEAFRDAIHLAVLPVEARIVLQPGEHVGADGDHMKPIGVVDPFLPHRVEIGEKFWLCIYPRTVTSLRHVWGHPKVPPEGYGRVIMDYKDVEKKAISKQWIVDYADRIGLSYDQLMEGAREKIDYDEYLVYGGQLEGMSTDHDFWEHYENVTGTTVDPNKKENFFSCSC